MWRMNAMGKSEPCLSLTVSRPGQPTGHAGQNRPIQEKQAGIDGMATQSSLTESIALAHYGVTVLKKAGLSAQDSSCNPAAIIPS